MKICLIKMHTENGFIYMEIIDSFPRHIVKGYASNTNVQVFHISVFTFEVVCPTGLMLNYFRLVLTLLHANVKASLTIFS